MIPSLNKYWLSAFHMSGCGCQNYYGEQNRFYPHGTHSPVQEGNINQVIM